MYYSVIALLSVLALTTWLGSSIFAGTATWALLHWDAKFGKRGLFIQNLIMVTMLRFASLNLAQLILGLISLDLYYSVAQMLPSPMLVILALGITAVTIESKVRIIRASILMHLMFRQKSGPL